MARMSGERENGSTNAAAMSYRWPRYLFSLLLARPMRSSRRAGGCGRARARGGTDRDETRARDDLCPRL